MIHILKKGILISMAFHCPLLIAGFIFGIKGEPEWLLKFLDSFFYIPAEFVIRFNTDILLTTIIYILAVGVVLGFSAQIYKKYLKT